MLNSEYGCQNSQKCNHHQEKLWILTSDCWILDSDLSLSLTNKFNL